ncbi:MAG: PAS-domain containing protein, partial [Alphaproteobacteria bacterium]|nr:PAS-domain containing protein [Alphaproteobacteria bacterium]
MRALAQPFTYLGVTLLLLIGAGLFFLTAHDRRSAFEGAVVKSEADARVFEEYIARTIKSADDKLVLLRKMVQRHPDNFELTEWTAEFVSGPQIALHFALVDRNGIVKMTTIGRVGADISGKESYLTAKSATDDHLIISRPYKLRSTDGWAIGLTRRLLAADGSFDGMILALLDPQQLDSFYRSITLGSDGIASLVGLDGYIRTRGDAEGISRPETFAGKSIGNASIFERIRHARSGSFWNNPGVVEPVSRLITYRQLADYPLLAIIGRSADEIYEPAVQSARIYYGMALFMAFGIILAIIAGANRQYKILLATRKLESMNLRFDTALENIAQGMCMFDAKGRITVCNRQYLEMYRLSGDVVKPGCTLQQLMRHRKDVGVLSGEPEDHCRRILAIA